MKKDMELICNCGNDSFVVLYDLRMGHADTETNWELLKCLDCGIIRTEKFETIR